MIIRRLDDIVGSEREVDGGNWCSKRLLLRADGLGFSLHDTLIRAGTQTLIWYRNHLEAVYCIEGRGSVTCTDDGTVYPIQAGTLYALDGHERHLLKAEEDLRLICVFTPPLSGREVHDAEGVYPPSGD